MDVSLKELVKAGSMTEAVKLKGRYYKSSATNRLECNLLFIVCLVLVSVFLRLKFSFKRFRRFNSLFYFNFQRLLYTDFPHLVQ